MRCAVMGVFAPLTGVIGSVQAVETLKILLDIGQTLNGRLLLLDGLSMEWRSIKLIRTHSAGSAARRSREKRVKTDI